MIYQEGGIYHLFNRGCDKRDIFLGESNYRFFLKKIRLLKVKFNLDIIAYCLMPNHFHLLVRQNSEVTIAKWIQKVLSGYVQAFNKQYNRKGTLFEGSTKPRVINKDIYLYNIIHYIHYNPIKAKLISDPADWSYSSYKIWISNSENSLISKKLREEFFYSAENYKQSFKEYTNSKLWEKDDLEN